HARLPARAPAALTAFAAGRRPAAARRAAGRCRVRRVVVAVLLSDASAQGTVYGVPAASGRQTDTRIRRTGTTGRRLRTLLRPELAGTRRGVPALDFQLAITRTRRGAMTSIGLGAPGVTVADAHRYTPLRENTRQTTNGPAATVESRLALLGSPPDPRATAPA